MVQFTHWRGGPTFSARKILQAKSKDRQKTSAPKDAANLHFYNNLS